MLKQLRAYSKQLDHPSYIYLLLNLCVCTTKQPLGIMLTRRMSAAQTAARAQSNPVSNAGHRPDRQSTAPMNNQTGMAVRNCDSHCIFCEFFSHIKQPSFQQLLIINEKRAIPYRCQTSSWKGCYQHHLLKLPALLKSSSPSKLQCPEPREGRIIPKRGI